MRLYTETARRIFAYIFVLIPEEDAANDIFQEVSITLWESFDQFEPGTNFYAWARQIAYHRMLQHRDRKQRDSLYLSEAVLEELAAHAGDATAQKLDRQRALAECTEKLSAQDRDLLDRRYAPGARAENVATELGRSLHQIYRALRRIHQTLFDCVQSALQEEGR